jgi:hypothetical protein
VPSQVDKKEQDLIDRLSLEPGNPLFAEYAEYLRRKKRFSESLNICLKGVNANPNFLLGRLALARIFYQNSLLQLAIRELEYIQNKLPSEPTVLTLLKKLSPDFVPLSSELPNKEIDNTLNQFSETVIAETEFELNDIDFTADKN